MRSLFGRTIFSRIFIFNVISVLICTIILGSVQVTMLTKYIYRKSEEALGKNADSIISLIDNNISADNLRGILNGFSRSSKSHIMVINDRGDVLVNTFESGFMHRNPVSIPNEFIKDVMNGKRNSMVGTMGGVFSETMFTLQVPIIRMMDKVVGAVVISIPVPQRQKMKNELFKITFISALFVIVISFLLSFILAKLFSIPIMDIRNSAKEFAKGNFDARVGKRATKSSINEIEELANTFNNMAYELEKVDEVRNTFISDVSHELRTPMTTISGFVNGILDDTIPEDKQKEYLKIVSDEVTRLSRLVNSFLDISRMQADKTKLNKTNFNINEIIRLSVIGFEKKIEENDIRLILNFESDESYVFADVDSIKRVLTNLLDNAIKFTNTSGEISVSVSSHQHYVYISVRNTGCGIPEEQQKMIFERLYKVDKSRSINREGTGIGLYLVKSIISAHGKKITLNSVEGEFAEFIFSLDKGKMPPKREEYLPEPEKE